MPSPRPGSKPRTFSGRIDGGARGNPGPAGIGILLEDEDGRRDEIYAYLGSTTNNVAEYAALLVLLDRCVRRSAKRLTVHSDSLLLVKQMLGEYKVKNPRLQEMHAAAKRLVARIPDVSLVHVPREENREADRLANLAMDERQSSEPLPEVVSKLLFSGRQERLTFSENG